MKPINFSIYILLALLLFAGCTGKNTRKKELAATADTSTVADTGYTGIKKYYSNDRLIKEVTFRNGVREGEMKSYYQGGQVYQRFWYENGLREDSAVWYFLEGQVFRTTPFVHDTMDGIQKQYYRGGNLRAKIKYVKGLRSQFFEEYNDKGKVITGYPEIVPVIKDNYKTNGQVMITLALSDKSTKVTFYRGELANGLFDTARCTRLKTVDGRASISLRKSATPQKDYEGVVAEIITGFGNRYIAYKKIDLPYKDLK
jgi:hypothetical protein